MFCTLSCFDIMVYKSCEEEGLVSFSKLVQLFSPLPPTPFRTHLTPPPFPILRVHAVYRSMMKGRPGYGQKVLLTLTPSLTDLKVLLGNTCDSVQFSPLTDRIVEVVVVGEGGRA